MMTAARPVMAARASAAGLGGGQVANKQTRALPARSSRPGLNKTRAMVEDPGMGQQAMEASQVYTAELAEEIAQDILGGRTRIGGDPHRRRQRQVRRAEEERLRELSLMQEPPQEDEGWSFKLLLL